MTSFTQIFYPIQFAQLNSNKEEQPQQQKVNRSVQLQMQSKSNTIMFSKGKI